MICFNFYFYIVRARNCMYVNVYWPRVSGFYIAYCVEFLNK